MGNSILKHRNWQRILTFLLAFAMLAVYIPVGSALAAEDGTHVLESNTLTAFDAGAKKDGEEEDYAGDDYFTILWSSKSKVDSSNKSWDDNYTSGQRINFGGTMSTSQNAVKFATDGAATVTVWWAEGGDDNRQVAIIDGNGDSVDATTGAHEKNSAYKDTLEIDAAGTYYLGGDIGNNYIFKIEVEEGGGGGASAPVTHTLETSTLTAFDAGAKKDGEEESYAGDDYFTILWSSKSKVDSSSKTFDDGYSSGQRINFGGTMSTSQNAVRFTTNAKSTVTVWWAEGGDDNRQVAIIDGNGDPVDATTGAHEKNSAYKDTLEIDAAGTYYLGGDIGNNYIFKIEVTEGGGGKAPRADWATVSAPVVTDVKLNDKGGIDVTVSALVDYDGGDKVTIVMSDASGAVIDSLDSSASASTHTKTFTPADSGTYSFTAKLIRKNETDKVSAEAKEFDYILPLTAPNIKSAANNGGGSVMVEWDPVHEATGYRVTVEGKDISEETEDNYCELIFTDEDFGKEYTIKVAALRGEEVGPEDTVEITVLDEVEIAWAFSAFGPSISTSKNDYKGNANEGEVQVWANGNGGKIVTAGADGVSFYYTKINPNTQNFELSATAHVNSWTWSNGQEGFGLMASDIIGTHGDGNDYFYNSYMAIATKDSYYWDPEFLMVTDDESAEKINMGLGLFAKANLGVNADALDSVLETKAYPIIETKTLETSAAQYGHDGTGWNIVGNFIPNATNDTLTPRTTANLVDFNLTIGKNNTGYYIKYTDARGNTTTEQYYEPDVLNEQEKDAVYVGFFTARNADVTFRNISFKTSNPKTDPPAQQRPITQVSPNFNIVSPSIASSPDYTLVYFGNAPGNLTINGGDGRKLYSGPVKENEKVYVENLRLTEGDNNFTWTMTPDRGYRPDNDEYKELSSYAPVSGTHTVTYGFHKRDIIYVSPTGTDSGEGSMNDPMSIYEAVKWVTPGQTIILMGGTYKLTSALTIERGISGTEGHYITMTADTNSGNRPVLDFGGVASGMTVAGDYWYLYGFDVTNSSDGNKGLQVSGSHNVLERLLTYKNGNTGIQVSRYKASDLTKVDWPSDNLILNCSSYLNADSGYEDADGFAAKLTVGDGNVFDGCIAAYNADDGWDFFAKGETGPIGMVTIQNSVAFKNGYILDERGKEIDAGNGNGFKMGGSSITGYHTLINSVAFGNKAKGFDSNSCPDIQVYNSTSYNNESYNVAFYTSSAANTDFEADGILSFKDFPAAAPEAGSNPNIREQLSPKGTQVTSKYEGVTNYYWDGTKSANSAGEEATADWFVSLDMNKAINNRSAGISRNRDGSINMRGFLELTDVVPEGVGAHLESVTQEHPDVSGGTSSTPSGGSSSHGSAGGAGGGGGAGGSGGAGGGDVSTPSTPTTPSAPTTPSTPSGGSTTTTTTAPDGTVTETVTKTDGSKSETVKATNGDITVTATAANGEVVARIELPAVVPALDYKFEDVPTGHWAEAAINTMAALNVVKGVSNDGGTASFDMDSNITRGAMAQILFNLSNGTEGKVESFGDVASGAWYTDAVAWAAAAGVVTGYSNSAFGPDDSITREQLAVMLYRYADLLGVSTSATGTLSSFTDAGSVSNWSADAMTWAVSKGLIQGKGANNLDPSASASRAETAVILQRFLEMMK